MAARAPPAALQLHARTYIHYAARASETTGPRLLTLHNLSFIQRLMADLRAAIDAGAPSPRQSLPRST